MLIFVQFPIADTRFFLKPEVTGHLNAPIWPSPNINPDKPEFMRYLGPVVQRKKGGIDSWVGEAKICKATKKMKLIDTCNDHITINSVHFFYDSFATAKFEFCFSVKCKTIDDHILSHLLYMLSNLRIEFNPSCRLRFKAKLSAFPRKLSEVYLLSSTKTEYHEYIKDKDYVCTGNPVFFIEFSPEENYKNSPENKYNISNNSNSYIYKFQVPHTIRPANINKDTEKIKTRLDNMNIWIGVRNSHPGNINLIKSELKRMRSIRINLLRLHSEVECFRNIMRYINKYGLILEGESRERKLFNKYLKGLYPRIFKYVKNDNFNAVDESMEGKFAFSAMRREYPGEFSGLLDILHNLEVMPQVFKANSHSFYVIANRNMGNLREEINLLIELMEKEARKPVHHDQLFLINQARIAIESENHAEAMMNLKKLNKWTRKIAEAAGLEICVSTIMYAVGLVVAHIKSSIL